MNFAKKLNLVSVEDYLAGELISPIKHEYLGGYVYAMAGGRNTHVIIETNLTTSLHNRLRGRSCRAFNSNTKIRVQLSTHVRFYYPDASVICQQNPQTDSFQDEPVVIFEILSKSTRRVDEGEKKEVYFTISSLGVYVLIEQEKAEIIAFRRTKDGFVPEVYRGMEAVLSLPEIGVDLPLKEVYEAVEFTPEPEEDPSKL